MSGTDPADAPPRSLDKVVDARRMRAVAHPMRIALLEALGREGPLTATRAAELLDDTPGNMSWHLQTLAKYGFVEEAGGGRGRSRPWRRAAETLDFVTGFGDADESAAGDALEAVYLERNNSRLREWWARRRSYPAKWRKAASGSDAVMYLTAEELKRLGEDVRKVWDPYRARTRDRSKRPSGAQPVHLVFYCHPLPPGPTGN
ncbi:MAG TPA: helix-turn-helix domain-containing protein [Gemmataceae bacterium]|jgi:DNA-binding transcriptional ArsR family regulator